MAQIEIKHPIENLEEAAQNHAKEMYGENWMDFEYTQDAAFRAMFNFKFGANWQKNRDKQILSTLYDDCSLLKDSLDKVTTGNLSHRIGNIKFSITGMQALIKQEMEDK